MISSIISITQIPNFFIFLYSLIGILYLLKVLVISVKFKNYLNTVVISVIMLLASIFTIMFQIVTSIIVISYLSNIIYNLLIDIFKELN